MIYSTFLGGTAGTFGNGIAVDGSHNAYVTGISFNNFPTTPGAYLTGSEGGTFVAKLNPTGSALVFAAQLGGSGSSSSDGGYRIAVDGSGNSYVMGVASSSDFPTTPSAYQRTFAVGTNSAFVTELNAAGTALVYSTFLSGGADGASTFFTAPLGGIAVDNHGNIYVTGAALARPSSPRKMLCNPHLAEAIPTPSWPRSILRRSGTASLVYSTYLGGSDEDEGNGIAVDSSGNAYATGFTYSLNFPTKNAYQSQRTASTAQERAQRCFRDEDLVQLKLIGHVLHLS